MFSNCLSRERRARRSLSKKLEEGKMENALSVLQQASWGITLLLAGLTGLATTLVLARGFRKDVDVYVRDAAFVKGLGNIRFISFVASGTMTVLAFAIASFFSVLYKLWVEWQLEKGITPCEVILPTQQAAGWLTLLSSWCASARWFPCAKGVSTAGHHPKSSTVWLLTASVLSSLVLSGCNLVALVLTPQEVSAPVLLDEPMMPQSISIRVPSACDLFSRYSVGDGIFSYDWEKVKDMAADGDNMWLRNVFDTSTLDVVNVSKRHNGLRARVVRALGWPAKRLPEPDGLRERLRMALGGDEYAKKEIFRLNDTWSNSVLFANGKKLNACTTKALKGDKINSANEWSVQEDQKILVGVVSARWTNESAPGNATQRISFNGDLEKNVYVDGPDCSGCWGLSLAFEDVRFLLRLNESAAGNASELTLWLRTGMAEERFALRASLLEVSGELSVEGRDNMVLGELRVRNYTLESRRFARTFACNILQVLMDEEFRPEIPSKCLNQSGPWHANYPAEGRSVSRMIKNAARLAPNGNVRADGAQLQLPGTVAAVLGYTVAMHLTDGKVNETGWDFGYGLRSQTVTVILPKMRTMLYTCIVLLEAGAAAVLLGASLCIARVTRHNSMKVDPFLFFSRLSKEEKERLELEDEVGGDGTMTWMTDGTFILSKRDGDVELKRKKADGDVEVTSQKAPGNDSP